MTYEIKNIQLSHDDLVNLLSTALYGCSFLEADYNHEDYDAVPEDKREGDCYEDKMADILLNGGHITIVDYYAEGEVYNTGTLDEDENGVYEVNLNDIIYGIEKTDGFPYAEELFIKEEGDYYTANNLLQIIMFGDVIYG